MAKINLLPWREERREQLKQEFLTNLVAVIVGAVVVIGLIFMLLGRSIDAQNDKNRYLQSHIETLNEQVSEISSINAHRDQLVDRMDIIQGLQGNRPVIVRVFDQFVKTLPDGIYYERLQRTNQQVEIDGVAESNNRVSSLMRRLDRSEWFSNPNLTAVVANPDFGEQANKFSLSVGLATPSVAGEEK